jgi:hypothetical protein
MFSLARPHTFGILCFLLLMALSLASAETVRPPIGAFTAVRLTKPPILDGKVTPGEWDGAFTTSGVIAAFDHQLLTSDTVWSIGWDAQKLYFLARCKRGAAEWRLTKGVRFNDDYDFGDPSIEIWISPPKPVAETYQNILNTYPAVMDNHQIPSRGYTGAGWRGNWQLGVSEDPDGYIIEAAIPIADFGMPGIKDGDRWRFLLCRTCQGAKPRSQGSWSLTQGFAELPQYPPVLFKDDDVTVQFTGIHTVLSGKYALPLTLVAPRGKDATLAIELRWQKGPLPNEATDIVETKTVTLKAGGRQTLDLHGDVPNPKGVLSVSVARQGGDSLFKQSFPYAVSGWAWTRPVRPENAPAIKPLATSVKYGPETHTLVLRADIFDLPARTQAAGAVVRVLDPAQGNKVLMTAKLPAFREWYSDAFLKLAGVDAPWWDHSKDDATLAEIQKLQAANVDGAKAAKEAKGRYEQELKRWQDRQAKDPAKAGEKPVEPAAFTARPVPPMPVGPAPRPVLVEVSAIDAAGNTLASDRQDIKLLRHKFTWQGTDAGVSDKVIAPWTPVKVSKDYFAVWNRTVGLDGLGCAKTIANGGVQQIHSMRLVAIVDGKETVIKAGAPKVGKTAEAWAEFTGSGEGAGVKLTATNRLEFDGYLSSDLTIAPQDSAKGAKLDELYWEVVLPEAEASHYCTTAGGWAAVHDTLPTRWTSQLTGSGMFAGDFVPYIWLTNSDRAFLWFADNDKGWITESERKVPTQEITRKDGLVTLRIRFIEVPTTLTAATTVRHGWMTFPSRPTPPGFRSVIVAQGTEHYPSARNTHFWTEADWAVLWPYYCSPYAWSFERSKGIFEDMAKFRGANYRPCVGSIAHSIGRYRDYEGRDFADFSVDWGEMPGVIGNSDVTQSKGPIDFRLHHYRRWVRESGFKGLYIDENYLSFDRNPLTGGAYVKADGRVQPGYTYTGLREYFKRMIYMFDAEGVARPNLWQHISSGAAYHSWYGDILMEGENVEPTDEEADYIETLPAGRMRAIGSPVVNGATTIMMCQSQRHASPWEKKHTHQFTGWVMAHDILPESVTWYGPLAQAGRLHRDDVRFVGYWKAENPAKTATPDCMVSMHKTDDRALLWVVNTARADRDVVVKLDWKALGFDRAKLMVVNAETGAEISLTGAGVTLPVLKRDFVAVLLVERRKLEPGQSLLATFDGGKAEADQAIGCEVFPGTGTLIDGDRGKALATGDRGVQLWGHLNLQDTRGRLVFRGQIAEGVYGVILSTTTNAPRGMAVAPGVIIERKKGGKDPDVVVIRLNAAQKKDEPPVPSVNTPLALTPGWHDFDLRWQGEQLTLTVDGQGAGTLAVPSLNLKPTIGPEILGAARIVFGGPRSPLTAIDELKAWR